MRKVNIQMAKSIPSQLLQEVEKGEDIEIARSGHAVARLSAFSEKPMHRKPGLLRKHPERKDFIYGPATFAPMTDDTVRTPGWA
jgi:antitoxin (DNA-binding transcriptional repressor) of toxin-antitoxin stability system